MHAVLRKRGRVAARAFLLAVALGLACPGAIGQESGTAVTPSAIGRLTVEAARLNAGSSRGARDAVPDQKALIQRIEAEAARRGPPGSPGHTSYLAGALRQIRTESSGGRGISTTSTSTAPIAGRGLAATPVEALRQAMREARAGTRVIGGQNTPDGWFMETVAIINVKMRDSGNDMGFSNACTGVIIAPRLVLTAGHCVCDLKMTPQMLNGGNVKIVVVGSDNMPRSEAEIYFEATVEHVRLKDPDFCARMTRFGESYLKGLDIALLVLLKKSNHTFRISRVPPSIAFDGVDAQAEQYGGPVVNTAPIATPFSVLSQELSELVVVGFGLNNTSVRSAGVKHFAAVPILSRICGFQLQEESFNCAPGLEIVLADMAGRRDTCAGDSGGPAFAVVRSGKVLSYYLVGITSRALKSDGSCGDGGIYTLVTPQVVAWIRRQAAQILALEHAAKPVPVAEAERMLLASDYPMQ